MTTLTATDTSSSASVLYNGTMRVDEGLRRSHEAGGRSRTSTLLHCFFLLLVVGGLWLPRLRGPIDLRFDAGVYYVLGTSLAAGQGYRLLNEPGEVPAVQYPPLLPATIAAYQKALGTSDPLRVGRALRVTSILASAAYVLLAYFVARRLVRPWWALPAALGCAGHMWFTFLSDLCFAEMPFALASTAFLLVVTSDVQRPSWRREAVAGALGVAGFLFRTAGVALLAAWVFEAVARRHWRHVALRAGVVIACMAGWQGYVASVRAGPSYERPAYAYQRAPYQYYNVSYGENLALIDPYDPPKGTLTAAGMIGRVATNLLDMPAVLGETVSAPRGFWYWLLQTVERGTGPLSLHRTYLAPAVALGALVICGLLVFLWQRRWLVVAYVALTALLIATTPWPPQFLRYTAPIAPLAFAALMVPLAAVASRAWRIEEVVWRRLLLTCVAGVIATVCIVEAFTLYKLYRGMHGQSRYTFAASRGRHASQRLIFYDDAWRSYDAALDWLSSRASRDDVIVTSAPHWAYLRTNAYAVQPPFEADADKALKLIEQIPATYVIVDAFTYPGGDVSRRYAAPALAAGEARWRLAFTSKDPPVRVYRRTD